MDRNNKRYKLQDIFYHIPLPAHKTVDKNRLFPTFFDGFSSKNKSQNHPSQMLYILHRNVYNRSIEWEDSTNES